MKCPDIEILQAYIDCELDITLKKDVEFHISTCSKCSEVFNRLKDNDDFAFSKIVSYKQFAEEKFIPSSSVPMPVTFENKNMNYKRGVFDFMKKYKRFGAAFCAAAVIVTCITVQPVRSAIASTLSIFRVQKMEGINITLKDLEEISSKLESNQSDINIDKIGNIKHEGGQLKNVEAGEIKNVADFEPLFPSVLEGNKVKASIVEPSSMELTLNVENINQLMKTLGSTKLLPKEIDGKTFFINFSSQVMLDYYNDDNNGKYVCIIEMKSPEIKVPSGVNVDEIYGSLVDLPILPKRLQQQLKSIKDWKNTLLVPVVESETEEININGVKAYISSKDDMQNNENSSGSYSSIIWYKDGIIYGIQGNVSKDEIINIAKSMR